MLREKSQTSDVLSEQPFVLLDVLQQPLCRLIRISL